MALSAADRVLVRLYMGWAERFFQYDSELEQAMNAIDALPSALALLQNALAASPPGILALLQDVDTKLTAAHARLKADNVGTIKLRQQELGQLRGEGRRHVGRLASFLGVPAHHDVFSASLPTGTASRWGMTGGGNRQQHG